MVGLGVAGAARVAVLLSGLTGVADDGLSGRLSSTDKFRLFLTIFVRSRLKRARALRVSPGSITMAAVAGVRGGGVRGAAKEDSATMPALKTSAIVQPRPELNDNSGISFS
jgi:hypothetical protein